ncbi:hypothetical protein DL96DRAFT_1617318 [Flagelloscypha sp. PMI_526]|nr:hypothetical protein DL96DRAFT_1617318 [Flagelloscypha sp. PMI_526]
MVEHTAFFYGTLMHPKILIQVIKNDGSHLRIAPAVLLEHTRHQVKSADYPGVVPISRSQKLFDHELSSDERVVRGTLVTGLTESDIRFLDYFEGSEYTREPVQIHPLRPFHALPALIHLPIPNDLITPSNPPPLPPASELPPAFAAETYIYRDVVYLRPELWSFDEFVKENAWKWYREGVNSDGKVDGEEGFVDESEAVNEIERRNAKTAEEEVSSGSAS